MNLLKKTSTSRSEWTIQRFFLTRICVSGFPRVRVAAPRLTHQNILPQKNVASFDRKQCFFNKMPLIGVKINNFGCLQVLFGKIGDITKMYVCVVTANIKN
jgi:hypothetical protein